MMTYLFPGLLGTAIGASTIDPPGWHNPFAGFDSSAGSWVAAPTLITLAVGALFAGCSAPDKGILRGVLCWSVITLYMISSLAGGAVSAASGVAKQGLLFAGNGVAFAAPGSASG